MPQKHEIYGFFFFFFYSFSKVFAKNIQKTYPAGNEEWIESETGAIARDYVVAWAFCKLSLRQNKCTYPEKTKNTFIFL